jgi:hypothetical protein
MRLNKGRANNDEGVKKRDGAQITCVIQVESWLLSANPVPALIALVCLSPISTSKAPTMVSAEEYDKMTPEERAVKDKADREREAKEQAGGWRSFHSLSSTHIW